MTTKERLFIGGVKRVCFPIDILIRRQTFACIGGAQAEFQTNNWFKKLKNSFLASKEKVRHLMPIF